MFSSCQTEQKYHLSESEQLGSDAISNEMQDPKNKVQAVLCLRGF